MPHLITPMPQQVTFFPPRVTSIRTDTGIDVIADQVDVIVYRNDASADQVNACRDEDDPSASRIDQTNRGAAASMDQVDAAHRPVALAASVRIPADHLSIAPVQQVLEGQPLRHFQ